MLRIKHIGSEKMRYLLGVMMFIISIIFFALMLLKNCLADNNVFHAENDLIAKNYENGSNDRQLTFEERVACQKAIEEIYWKYRIWPKENPQPKPALEKNLSDKDIAAKVEDTLRKSDVLGYYWQRPITGEQLQAEINRMAKSTRKPQMLKELFFALGNNPYLIAECLARPILSDRLIHDFYSYDETFHGELKNKIQKELEKYTEAEQMILMSGKYQVMEWIKESKNSVHAKEKIRGKENKAYVNEEDWNAMLNNLKMHMKIEPSKENNQNANKDLYGIQVGRISRLIESEESFKVIAVLEKK